MSEEASPGPPREVPPQGTPPLGSWPRFYALTCLVAVVYVLVLWWFTAAFNHPGGGG